MIIVSSTVAVLFALATAGVEFSWGSFHILVPLIIGFLGIGAWFAVERWVIAEPTVKSAILRELVILY